MVIPATTTCLLAMTILPPSRSWTFGQLVDFADQSNLRTIWDAIRRLRLRHAAFVAAGVNGNRVAEGGTVAFDFTELNVFLG